MFKKSLRLSTILTILNLVFSLVLSMIYSGNLESDLFLGYFGNVTLFEAMFLFLYGSAIDYTSTERWASTMRLLKLTNKVNENTDVLDGCAKESKSEKTRNAETRAIIYVLSGAVLLVEIIILALING